MTTIHNKELIYNMTLITPDGINLPDTIHYLSTENWLQRMSYTHAVSWHLTNEIIIDMLCKYSPVLSVGSGKGFTESIAKKNGCDIICTDECAVENNPYHTKRDFICIKEYNQYLNNKSFMDIETIKATKAIKKYPDRNVFMAWCPYSENMGYDVVKVIKNQVLMCIGEPEGGCTGNDKMFNYLYNNYNVIDSISIPQWGGMHDGLTIYKRKETKDNY